MTFWQSGLSHSQPTLFMSGARLTYHRFVAHHSGQGCQNNQNGQLLLMMVMAQYRKTLNIVQISTIFLPNSNTFQSEEVISINFGTPKFVKISVD